MTDTQLISVLLTAAAQQENLLFKALLEMAAQRIAELKILVETK